MLAFLTDPFKIKFFFKSVRQIIQTHKVPFPLLFYHLHLQAIFSKRQVTLCSNISTAFFRILFLPFCTYQLVNGDTLLGIDSTLNTQH
mgnify:CR=1 FL=1